MVRSNWNGNEGASGITRSVNRKHPARTDYDWMSLNVVYWLLTRRKEGTQFHNISS